MKADPTVYDVTTPEEAAQVLSCGYGDDAAVVALSRMMQARAGGDAMDWLFWSRVIGILHPYGYDPCRRA